MVPILGTIIAGNSARLAPLETWAVSRYPEMADADLTAMAERPGAPGCEDLALMREAEQEDDTCQSARLTAEGRAGTGPSRDLARPAPTLGFWQCLGLWPDWLARFAAVESETPSGRAVSKGQRKEEAVTAWQRGLGEWARDVWLELQAAHSAAWGTALAGHWQTSGSAGVDRRPYCQFLQTETYSYAYATAACCEGGETHDLGCGWLETSEWLPFDACSMAGQP